MLKIFIKSLTVVIALVSLPTDAYTYSTTNLTKEIRLNFENFPDIKLKIPDDMDSYLSMRGFSINSKGLQGLNFDIYYADDITQKINTINDCDNENTYKIDSYSYSNRLTKLKIYTECNNIPKYIINNYASQLSRFIVTPYGNITEKNIDIIEAIVGSISIPDTILNENLIDISKTYISIVYLYEQGIIQGYEDNTFRPGQPINRAEFTKIVVGATQELETTGSGCFSDVTDEWFAPFVCTAKSSTLIDGYPDGTFRPAENINFVEAAKIVANAFKLDLEGYKTDSWYEPYVRALADSNAIPNTVTSLDQVLTRGEMAHIIYRLHAEMDDLPSRKYEDF